MIMFGDKDLEGDGKVLFEGRPNIPEFAWGDENTAALIRKEFFSNTIIVNYLTNKISEKSR
jgi:hypothetical protein